MYAAIQTTRLYEKIVEQISGVIASGALQAGDQLPPERELAQQFGVSRTAVREAVKALRERGLVEIQSGRGTFITDPSDSASDIVRDSLALFLQADWPAGVAALLEVRAILEPEIAARAANHATQGDLRELRALVARMDEAVEDREVFVEADLDFHLALARATQNSLIPVLIDPVIGLLREHRRRIFDVRGGAERGQAHHRRILAAVETGDANAARQAMLAHLQQIVEDSAAIEDGAPREEE